MANPPGLWPERWRMLPGLPAEYREIGALMLSVRTHDTELQRKGRVLAVMLLGIETALLIITLLNLYAGEAQYDLTNLVLILAVFGLYLLNRLSFVRIASLLTLVLCCAVPLLLVDQSMVGTYTAMVIPILVASSLIVPWGGFVVAALMIAFAFIFDIASLSLVMFVPISALAYLFAGSINRAYLENRHRALHDGLTGLPNRSLLVDHVQQAVDRSARDNKPCAVLFMDLDDFRSSTTASATRREMSCWSRWAAA